MDERRLHLLSHQIKRTTEHALTCGECRKRARSMLETPNYERKAELLLAIDQHEALKTSQWYRKRRLLS